MAGLGETFGLYFCLKVTLKQSIESLEALRTQCFLPERKMNMRRTSTDGYPPTKCTTSPSRLHLGTTQGELKLQGRSCRPFVGLFCGHSVSSEAILPWKIGEGSSERPSYLVVLALGGVQQFLGLLPNVIRIAGHG